MNLRRSTFLVMVIGFGASLGGFFTDTLPWLSLLAGLVATVLVAGLLDLAASRRDEALRLISELETKNSQLNEALRHQVEAEQRLRQAHRLEAVGQLAGGIAHDFNNLLQSILSYSEFLSDAIDPESELQQDVAEVQKAARRAAGLTRQLLVFSRQQLTQPVVVDLNDSVRSAEHLLRSMLRDDIELTCRTAAEPCLVFADVGELELMLMNLAINARDAMPRGGTITVAVEAVEMEGTESSGLRPGPFARIGVTDDGEGMTPEVAAKAFEPFFTTKETGRGNGLGLSMVYGIADRSGGRASIATAAGVGTTIAVLLPLSENGSRPAISDVTPMLAQRVLQ